MGLIQKRTFISKIVVIVASIVFLALTTSAAIGDATGTVTTDSWLGETVLNKTYSSGNGYDRATGIEQTPDGNMVVIGRRGGSNIDWRVTKINKTTGKNIWTNIYDYQGDDDYPYDVAVSGDGSIIVTGGTYNGNEIDWNVAKYNSNTGDLIWRKTRKVGRNNYARSATRTSNDTVVVAGYTDATGNSNYIWRLVKYNSSTGDQIWTKTVNYGYDSYAYSVTEVSDGNILAVGRDGSDDWRVSKFNVSNGNEIWTQSWDGIGSPDLAFDVVGLGKGFAVTGYTDNGNNYDFRTVKYNSSGDREWIQTYNSGRNDYGRSIDSIGNGSVFIGGYTYNGYDDDLLVSQLSIETGERLGSWRWDSGGNDGMYQSGQLEWTGSNLWITGQSDGVPSNDGSHDWLMFKQNFRFSGGSGTSSDPYEISTCEQLQNMNQNLSAHYELVSDVDCSGTENWNNGKGFKPIGYDTDNRFNASFAGGGNIVSEVYINRGSTNHVGLFGYVGKGGKIEEVGVKSVEVVGSVQVGGLVGLSRGAVSESFSTGSISGSQNEGGLVGLNTGSISNSYSWASVAGSYYDGGGLVGDNYGPVYDSYSSGSVYGSAQNLGGLIGNNDGSISSSYWDTESSGQSSSAGGVGLTTSEMQGSSAESNMPGLDFTSTWGTREGDYPGLYWESDVFIPDDLQNPDWSFNGHSGSVVGVAVDSDGNVYSASGDDTVRMIDSNGNEVWSFNGHSGSVYGVAVDSDGYVYSASVDGTVKKIDSSGNEVWTFNGHSSTIYGVTVDSDGYVYSASADGTVKKIDSNGNEVWSFNGHSGSVRGVAVDSDGYVYSASLDGTVRKISPSGDQLDSFTVNDDYAYSVGVSPVSSSGFQYVAAGTGYSNNNIYRWTQNVSSTGMGSDIAICDSRGPFNECVSNSSHNVSSGSFSISSVFQAEESAVFESLFGMASISVDNSTVLSGLWRGSFNISTPRQEETVIKPGAEFKPEKGRIIVGN